MKIPITKRYSIYKKLALQDERSKELDFDKDGREHYVYRVTDYTRTDKEHYYGSHTPEFNKKYNTLEEEFWTYRTSSNYNILNEDKKEDYKVKILKVFNNPADKIIYESFLHQYFDAKRHTKFWNESNQTPFGFDTTGKVSVRDKEGNIFSVSIDDPRYLSGELVGTSKDIIQIVDIYGFSEYIHKNNFDEKTMKFKKDDFILVQSKKENEFIFIDKEEYYKNKELYKKIHIKPYKKINVYINGIKRTISEKDYSKYTDIFLANEVIKVMDKEENESYISRHDPRYGVSLFNVQKGKKVDNDVNKGKVVVKDKEGNTFRVDINDPRYLSGELVVIASNTITVKDKNGNTFRVSIDDPRYLSGELVGINKGKVVVKDKDNNTFIVDMDHPLYLSGELVHINKNRIPWNKGKTNIYSEEVTAKIREKSKNKVVVKDANGNTLKVDIDDPRYLSGELVGVTKGLFTVYDILLDKNIQVNKEEYKNNNFLLMNSLKYCYEKDNQLFRKIDLVDKKSKYKKITREEYIKLKRIEYDYKKRN